MVQFFTRGPTTPNRDHKDSEQKTLTREEKKHILSIGNLKI